MNLEESIKLAVESLGAQLYDIVNTKEHDKNIYRVYVTSPEGINLDKCAEI
jgi:ribosome maturation factor RimP